MNPRCALIHATQCSQLSCFWWARRNDPLALWKGRNRLKGSLVLRQPVLRHNERVTQTNEVDIVADCTRDSIGCIVFRACIHQACDFEILTKGSLEWYVFHHLVLGDPFGVIVRRLVDYKLKPPALLELDRIESAIQMLAMYSDPVSGGKVDWPVVATEAEFEAALDLAQSWLTHRAVRPVAWNAMDRSHVLILIAILYSIYENLSRRLSDTYLDDEVELAP